jgi:hypothetical protein
MPKKKVQFPKRNKAIKRNVIIASVSAIVVITAIVLTVVLVNHSRSWIMEFEGKRVPIAEFEFFAREVKAGMEEEWQFSNIWEGTQFDRSSEAKDVTLQNLQESLALASFARLHGVTFPPHLIAEIDAEIAEYRNLYRQFFNKSLDIPTARLREIIGTNHLIDLIVEKIIETHDIEIDFTDFEQQVEDYLNDDKWAYYEITLTPFVVYTLNDAVDFVSELRDTSNEFTFHELSEIYYDRLFPVPEKCEDGEDCEDEDCELDHTPEVEEIEKCENGEDCEDEDCELDHTEEFIWTLMDFLNEFGYNMEDIDLIRELGNLQQGEVSGVLVSPHGGIWAVIYIEERTPPENPDEITEGWRENFIESEHQNYVFALLQEYVDSRTFEVNNRALNAFRIGRL